MNERAFRFGVIGTAQSADQWTGLARRVEELGYSTLLSPDSMTLLSPLPALAAAASITARLRVGTFVMASPLRPPQVAAWEAHSMSVLTDGRFEFGIGAGHPQTVKQAVEVLGQPERSGGQRLALVEQTIDHLRKLDGERHIPVMIAASGPRARALAARKADIVTLSAGPLGTRDQMKQMTAELRAAAGDRAEQIELAMNCFVVGDQVPQWVQAFLGVDAATMIERDSLMMLRGDTVQIADELQRRREAFGISYCAVNMDFLQQLAPVVELLQGR